jgi:butyrate kinase
MMTSISILVLNPGSTSTKLAWFAGMKKVWEKEISHSQTELGKFEDVFSQLSWRCRLTERALRAGGLDASGARLVAGRGGLMKPVSGGAYRVNAAMLADLRQSKKRWGLEHASNLGAAMAVHFAVRGAVACVVDPVSTDELQDRARTSGVPGLERQSLLHALNTRAVCRWAAKKLGKPLAKTAFVVGHLGGGSSISAISGGKIVDTTDAVGGQGPFTANRAGSLPSRLLLGLVEKKKWDRAQALRFLLKECGLRGYLGTAELPQAEKLARSGNRQAGLILDSLAYQCAKDLAAYASVLRGKLDAVILTGGMAHSRSLVRDIRRQAGFLGRFLVLPGQLEMEALAQGALEAYEKGTFRIYA